MTARCGLILPLPEFIHRVSCFQVILPPTLIIWYSVVSCYELWYKASKIYMNKAELDDTAQSTYIDLQPSAFVGATFPTIHFSLQQKPNVFSSTLLPHPHPHPHPHPPTTMHRKIPLHLPRYRNRRRPRLPRKLILHTLQPHAASKLPSSIQMRNGTHTQLQPEYFEQRGSYPRIRTSHIQVRLGGQRG
jgi:hypothetical protein